MKIIFTSEILRNTQALRMIGNTCSNICGNCCGINVVHNDPPPKRPFVFYTSSVRGCPWLMIHRFLLLDTLPLLASWKCAGSETGESKEILWAQWSWLQKVTNSYKCTCIVCYWFILRTPHSLFPELQICMVAWKACSQMHNVCKWGEFHVITHPSMLCPTISSTNWEGAI